MVEQNKINMKTTYLLIEITRENQSIIEDIHGVGNSVELLKEVAQEENDDAEADYADAKAR